MKQILLIFILIGTLKTTYAQTSGVPDTLSYLKSIVTKKGNFIGQPFSNLLASLEIEIKFFTPKAGERHDISKETSTAFGWYPVQTTEDIALAYPLLEIYWQPCLNMQQSLNLFNIMRWSAPVEAHYYTGIISDIRIRL